ncbi:10968_t:CDS:2 [Paraglomus brasilianum]|uniref:10968_t:CDS:1 n=1 Tax=Paraglomus brasilianum TaxID=144538 RepID=A0A9N9GJW3_9GLOM|nr:10968_t:CDS:2 [Paraglomus brasilianum]
MAGKIPDNLDAYSTYSNTLPASEMTDIRISTKSKAITKLPPTKKGLKKIKSRIKRELEEKKRERKANLERECVEEEWDEETIKAANLEYNMACLLLNLESPEERRLKQKLLSLRASNVKKDEMDLVRKPNKKKSI